MFWRQYDSTMTASSLHVIRQRHLSMAHIDPAYLTQVLLGPEMGSRTVHFDALRREVQLAARFNSERLVQVRSSSLYKLAPLLCTVEMPGIIRPSLGP